MRPTYVVYLVSICRTFLYCTKKFKKINKNGLKLVVHSWDNDSDLYIWHQLLKIPPPSIIAKIPLLWPLKLFNDIGLKKEIFLWRWNNMRHTEVGENFQDL